MHALSGERERGSPFVRLATRVGGVNAKWEVLNQVVNYFGYVEPFLRENEDICPANRQIGWRYLMIPKPVKIYGWS